METLDIASLRTYTLVLTFGLGVLFGGIGQRSQFCTMGAIADIVNIGDWARMRQWLLAIAVAMLGTNLLASGGLIDLSKTIYTAPRLIWLAHMAGGTLFGFGMVLASGCGNRSLVRLGGGNLKSLVVLLVMGLTAFMTLKGILAVPRVYVLESVAMNLPVSQDLPSLLAQFGWSKSALQFGLSIAVAGAVLMFVFANREFRLWRNFAPALALGLIIVAAWYVTGKFAYVAEDPDTLQEAFLTTNSGKMESLSFVAPLAYTLNLLMFWTDKTQVLSFGIVATLGVVCGAFLSAVLSRSFRLEGFADAADLSHHLIGAALMGFGGITALGCTIGQGLAGISTLALGSILTVFAIVGGAIVALAYQTWRA
jgi:uncharacterized membrane protein YedE/YeeE